MTVGTHWIATIAARGLSIVDGRTGQTLITTFAADCAGREIDMTPEWNEEMRGPRMSDATGKVIFKYQKQGYRTFARVSFSDDRYDMIGNARNYGLDYNWIMHPRGAVRNDVAYRPRNTGGTK